MTMFIYSLWQMFAFWLTFVVCSEYVLQILFVCCLDSLEGFSHPWNVLESINDIISLSKTHTHTSLISVIAIVFIKTLLMPPKHHLSVDGLFWLSITNETSWNSWKSLIPAKLCVSVRSWHEEIEGNCSINLIRCYHGHV